MAEVQGIVAYLDLCVGCYACIVACKQENNLPMGTQWMKVMRVGPHTVKGKPLMDFIPTMTEECHFCEHRLKEDMEPRCVANCPFQALGFFENGTELLEILYSGKRFHICKLNGESVAFG